MQQWQSERKALKQQLQQVRTQSEEAQVRLEETAWSLCNRNGEMALLKSQLKDAHVSHPSDLIALTRHRLLSTFWWLK